MLWQIARLLGTAVRFGTGQVGKYTEGPQRSVSGGENFDQKVLLQNHRLITKCYKHDRGIEDVSFFDLLGSKTQLIQCSVESRCVHCHKAGYGLSVLWGLA